jgi:hypothetical protein
MLDHDERLDPLTSSASLDPALRSRASWRRPPRTALARASLGLVALACSDDGARLLAPSAADPSVPSADGSPLYLIATSFITGDQIETYLVTSPTFDESTVIDPTNGPKLLGGIDMTVSGGRAFGPQSNGPVLVRYDVDASDQLVQSAELSFAGVGMTSLLGSHVYIVSDTKGYVFDPSGPRIVVWDPSTMTLTGTQIDLSATSRPGWVPNLNMGLVNQGAIRRGSELLIPLNWQDQDGNSRFASGALVIDSDTDAVIGVSEDERCGETFTHIAAPNGDVYFFPPAWSSTSHYFIDMHQPTCVLRIRPGESSFDPQFALDLSALGSGSAAAGAIPDGRSGFYFASVDPALWTARSSDLAAFWRLSHYDFASETSRELTTLPVWTGHAHYVDLGGEIVFVYWEETATGNRTTFYRADAGDEPTQLFSYDASWYSFARLR